MHLPADMAIVGRDREQAELATALTSTRAGHGRAVLLLGEAGMGKSMLADWLVSQAEHSGMQVARGACSAAGMPPLWPWRRSLAAIGLKLPWRKERVDAGPSDRELMAAAIVETVAAAAARQPLLIVLEDMHWSDPVSVLVAQAAAEAVAALPLALLLTCRDEWDEATHEVRDRLAELPASVRRMLLPPLDADAVATLARSIVGPGLDNQVAASLQARTGGNPFFAHEVARLIAARGPAATFMVPPAQDAVRMASAAGDQLIEVAVLAAYCDAIAGPDYVHERKEAADRMLSLATDLPEASLQRQASVLLARRLLLVAVLEQGDLPGAEQQAAAYERAARRLGIPGYGWLPEIWRAMRALLDGEPDSALEHAAAAEAIGRRADNAQLMAFTARMQAHLDRGTAAEYADDVSTLMAAAGPDIPGMYYAAPARLLLAADDASQARAVLRALLAGPAQARPKDAEWLECHWAMADLAISLDDRAAAIRLAADLAPYEVLWAVDGMGGAVFGVVAEQLGRLAAYLGQPDEAARYLATARDRYERAGAPALRVRVDAPAVPQSQAAASRPADGSGLLRRSGQVWLAEWHGRRSIVPDSKGIRDLAVLLARPGEPVPALELVEAAGGPPAAAAGGSLGPVLDATARRAYQQRLADLEDELAEAEANADTGQVDRLRAERSMLAAELAGALGLGGRARFAGDPAERARKAVTMRIRAAISTIAAQDDTLARHLRNTIRTGRLCSYQPEEAVSWRT